MKRTRLLRKTAMKKRPRRKQRSEELQRHWNVVGMLGCMVCEHSIVTLHHVHGGSMRGVASRGTGQKTSDWLVIPLCHNHHVGEEGIDNGIRFTVVSWEAIYGTQLEYVKRLGVLVGRDLIARANGKAA